MAKPDDLPVWATDANYPAGSNPWNGTPTKVEPDVGEQQAGLEPTVPPDAQVLNWLLNLICLWLAWLDGLFDDNGNFTLDEDASVKISGDGKYKRGEKIRPLSVNSGKWISDDVTVNQRFNANGVPKFTGTGGNSWWAYAIPLVVQQDERIKAVSVWTVCNVTDVLKMELWKTPSNSALGASQIGATQTSTDHTMTPEELTITGLTEAVDGTASYHLYIYCTARAGDPTVIGAQQITDVPD